MSNNPGGSNQFGSYQIQPPFGDVKRQTELTRSAPMSGAPVAGRALGAPRAASRATQTRKGAVAAQTPLTGNVTPPPLPPPSVATLWQRIAAIPGISPLAQEYADAARGTA